MKLENISHPIKSDKKFLMLLKIENLARNM
jgi:hypothetical protein